MSPLLRVFKRALFNYQLSIKMLTCNAYHKTIFTLYNIANDLAHKLFGEKYFVCFSRHPAKSDYRNMRKLALIVS